MAVIGEVDHGSRSRGPLHPAEAVFFFFCIMIFSVRIPCETKLPSKLKEIPAWAEHSRTFTFLPLRLACHLIHLSFAWRSHRQLGWHQVDLLHIRCGLATPAVLQIAAKNCQTQRTCAMVETCKQDPKCQKKPGP